MSQDVETVANLTSRIQGLLQHGIGDVVVCGEVSNYKHHTSGHRYFTLKDESASISCVMWRTRPLSIRPEDGMRVVLHGRLTVYPPRGNYQIDVVSMAPAGMGTLQQQLEERKKELAARGFFSWERKRSLPSMPMRIGVVTSPTGAALQDILSTIASRFPIATVMFRPALVQGPGAAEDIATAIGEFSPDVVDLLIVGRGGGSIEDLWAFNEINVAEALFASSVPIISAVGHETDDTLADLVADVRAATPTHAAVLATPLTRADVMAHVAESRERLMAAMASSVSEARDMVQLFSDGASARRLLERIALRQQWIDDRLDRSSHTLLERLRVRRERLAMMPPRAAASILERLRGRSSRLADFGSRYALTFSQRLRIRGAMLMENRTRACSAILRHISRTVAVVDRHHAVCRALYPLAPLRRGFAVVERNNVVLRPTDLLQPGDVVTVRRSSQLATVVVQSSEVSHGPTEA
ncbi:MAG: exodeoxyribonuclease VII large subunit [Candidatus Kapabacteria bacterium]|nr:exodeoxyribonuclease VII large subunit [Candidatus Kapabacteria bacterium]